MVKTTKFANPSRLRLIKELKKLAREEKAPIWRAVAEALGRVRRNRPEVNVGKISCYTRKDDYVVVPGKVLGDGKLEHSVVIAAFKFTEGALLKIEKAGGKALSIQELAKQNPKGSNIKIIG